MICSWRQQNRDDNDTDDSKKVEKSKNGAKNGLLLNENNPNLHNSFYGEGKILYIDIKFVFNVTCKLSEALFKSEKIFQMDRSEPEQHRNILQISEETTKEILDALRSDSELELSSSSRELRISKRILTYLKE